MTTTTEVGNLILVPEFAGTEPKENRPMNTATYTPSPIVEDRSGAFATQTTRIAVAAMGIFTIELFHRISFSGPEGGWWIVQVTDALGVHAHDERIDSLDDGRAIANAAWRLARENTVRDGGLNAQEVVEMATVEVIDTYADERCCECEIDWKCPLCQETGRYHSVLDR